MNDLNLHGRHPKDLPDKETIEDILQELKDTKKFKIQWVKLNGSGQYSYVNPSTGCGILFSESRHGWRVNNKTFREWIESGEVATHEMDSSYKMEETRYKLLRYPIRLDISLSATISDFKGVDSLPIKELSKDTYLRLKDYLGPDVIQDQFSFFDFIIDFMLTTESNQEIYM